MVQEIKFSKYEKQGAYHWGQMSLSPLRANSFVKARYFMCVRLIAENLVPVGAKVLDVGCGDGVLAYLLSKNGYEVIGIDNSKTAIMYAKQKHSEYNTCCDFKVADCYRTGFPSDSFDCVICSEVVEHVQSPSQLLTEIGRVVKPGGLVLISTPLRLTYAPLDSLHKAEWFKEEFEALVSTHFLKVRHVSSHPLFWMELFNRSRILRVLVNVVSVFCNPFLNISGWRHYALQYVVARKS